MRSRVLSVRWAVAAAALTLMGGPPALAQFEVPVYVDDSATASEAVARAREMRAIGNVREAIAVFQSLLDNEGERVLAVEGDPDLFTSVRVRIESLIRADAELLARYEDIEGATAARMLGAGELERAASTRLLTAAGFEAAMRLIQARVEDAEFGQALVELRSLDAHPRRSGDGATAALKLLETVCAYAGADGRNSGRATRREALLLRARWREGMGLGVGGEIGVAEAPDLQIGRGPLDRADARDITSLLPRSLATAVIGEAPTDASRPRSIDLATELRVLPVVSGDTVYVTDGLSVLALDRFTLSKRWEVRVPVTGRTSMMRGTYGYASRPIDLLMPAVEGGTVVVVGGDGPDTARMTGADRMVMCIDGATGQLRWSTTLRSEADDALTESIVRGPAMIEGGVVVCSALRMNQQKRLAGAYLVGLEIDTGRVRWLRNIGSVGTESAPLFASESSLPTVAGGLVYIDDPVGVLAAVEASTGRVRWVRRLERARLRSAGRRDAAWRVGAPIVHDGKVMICAGDGRTILIFDAWTGEPLEVVNAQAMNNPDYLLVAGEANEWLLGVSISSVVAKPIDRLVEPVPVKWVGRVPDGGIRGRVVVAGDRVLIPTGEGVRVADLGEADPESTSTQIALEHPGQIVAMPSALVVADNERAHTYLVWEKASELLRRRMEDSPRDATAAVTFAELSYRAGQGDQIVSSVDRALDSLSADPESAANEAARSRLFAALLEMIESDAEAPTTINLPMRRALLDRLGRAAASPAEQVAHLMAAGRTAEMMASPGEAVAEYQKILETASLAAAEYRHARTGVPAASEATRRIRRLVIENGPEVYAEFDAAAERELDRVNWSLSPEAFEEIARRYPMSRGAARAWIEAADRHTTGGRAHMAIFALEEALRVARVVLPRGDALTSEAAGRLIHRLEASRRVRNALAALDDVTGRDPEFVLTDHGRVMDAGAWRAQLREELARLERRPAIGSLEGNGVLLAGMGVVRAEQHAGPGAPTDRIMLYDGSTGKIGMWKADGKGGLERAWGGVSGESVVRIDERGVLLAKQAGARSRDRVLVMRDAGTGDVMWETAPVRSLLPPMETLEKIMDEGRGNERFPTPVELSVTLSELIVLVDADTVVVVERSGRAAGFDAGTGTHLWSASTRVGRVHDAALRGGALSVGGDMPPDGVEVGSWIMQAPDARHGVVALDARTGRSLMTQMEGTAIRWVRATDGGGVVYGTSTGIAMLDPFRGALVWRNEEFPARETLDAQVLGERCLVMGAEGEVRQLYMGDGVMRTTPLDAKDRLDAGRGEAVIVSMSGKTVIASELGVAVFDEAGELVGVDQRATDWKVLPGAFAEGKVCTLAQMGQVLALERSLYEFNATEVETVRSVENRRVELPAPPRDLSVVEGVVVIGTSDGVVVIPAPATGG